MKRNMYNINDIKNKIFCEGALSFLRNIPSESIDLVVTDPPYGVNYKGGVQNQDDNNIIEGDDSAGFYKTLIKECYRILKVGGGGAYIFYALGNANDIFPIDSFEKFQTLIWYKIVGGFPSPMARYMHTYEPILYLTKKSPTKWRGGSKEIDMFITFKGKEHILHPTQKPLKLISRLIENSSDKGDIVLDPFLGSGTTAVAAKLLDRNYIGVEINPDYVKMAEERLKLE